MRSADALVRQYLLAYEAGVGGLSRLKTFTECTDSTFDCLAPTTFDWYDAPEGFQATSVNDPAYSGTFSHFYAVDLNRDGRDDLVWHSGFNGQWRFAFGQTGGQLGPAMNGPAVAQVLWSMPIEWDGDGRTDLLYASANQFFVARSNGGGFDAPIATGAPYDAAFDYWAADLDGDGFDDLARISMTPQQPGNPDAGKIWVRLRRGTGWGAEVLAYHNSLAWFFGGFGANVGGRTHMRRHDFNGDGRMDLLVSGCSGFEVELGTCTGPRGWYTLYSRAEATAAAVSAGTGLEDAGWLENSGAHDLIRPVMGDFNADGKTDLAYPGAQYWFLYESGAGYGGVVVQGPAFSGYNPSGTLVADYDGDGYSDLFAHAPGRGRIEVMRSNGEALEAPVASGVNSAMIVADFGGDGLPDLFDLGNAGYTVWTHHHAGPNGTRPNLLRRASDGFGVFAEFTYRPMSDASLHTKSVGANLPVVDWADSRPLVSQLTQMGGDGAAYVMSYTYAGARRDIRGRGFLGFAQRTMIDGRGGHNLRIDEHYRQDLPFAGALTQWQLRQASGTLINHTKHLGCARCGGRRHAALLPLRFSIRDAAL